MSEYIEIIFEGIEFNKIYSFISDLINIRDVTLIKYFNQSNPQTKDINLKISLQQYLLRAPITSGSMNIKVKSIKLENLLIKNIDVWLYFDTNIDCIIVFEIEDLQNFIALSVPQLLKMANIISEKHNIKNYYCGIEPAQDENTRFFTRNTLGPIK